MDAGLQKTWHDFWVELYVLAGHNERSNKCENKEMMSEVWEAEK